MRCALIAQELGRVCCAGKFREKLNKILLCQSGEGSSVVVASVFLTRVCCAMSLFREEVSEYRKIRLHGEVVLSQSLSSRVMAAALIMSMAIIVTWVSLGSYARIETAPGILVTQNPSSKIVAPVPGVLRE